MYSYFCSYFSNYFYRIGPRGQFSLVVAMSVRLFIVCCPLPRGAKEVPGEQSCLPRWHQYPEKHTFFSSSSKRPLGRRRRQRPQQGQQGWRFFYYYFFGWKSVHRFGVSRMRDFLRGKVEQFLKTIILPIKTQTWQKLSMYNSEAHFFKLQLSKLLIAISQFNMFWWY